MISGDFCNRRCSPGEVISNVIGQQLANIKPHVVVPDSEIIGETILRVVTGKCARKLYLVTTPA